ncbi:glycosyltransferase [Methanobacterium sp. SMA-27]|uniref:glycosyltransferase family 2 protein n=1 Tax=Methanobacterium sp. SMA-27 TaxID=1495336 RepID=UPI00064FC3F7|nr:glycosyltransferase [Methanobacterium sp. SMA-27]
MNDVKVSIIVPVYNVEKYLRQCVDSIVNQSLKEIEIICINDGSTDNSLQILEGYAQRDKRIKIINKRNEGLSAARNTGMEYATGEYIGFVDSDDFINEKMYENLYINAKSNKSDIVMCPAYVFDDNNPELNHKKPYFSLECLDKKFDNKVFDHTNTKNLIFKVNVTCWNKIYKSQFLNEIGAKFHKMYFEDNIFFYETYLKAKKISLIRDFLYYYRINRAGSFIKEGNKKFFDICNMHDLLKKILIETGNLDEYLESFLNFKINGSLGRYNQVDERFKPEFFEIIKQNFIKNNLKKSDIDKLSQNNKIKYQNILISDTYKEYGLREQIYQLNSANQEYEQKYQQLEYNLERLKDKNQGYEKEINTQKHFIQKITSSNSWKLTKPLRKIRNLIN